MKRKLELKGKYCNAFRFNQLKRTKHKQTKNANRVIFIFVYLRKLSRLG